MSKFVTEILSNQDYRFEIFVNTKKLTWQQIKGSKNCARIINLGYFDLKKFTPNEGLIVDGRTLLTPRYQDWGVTIDADGNLGRDVPASASGKLNYCPAVPPMLKNGAKAAAAQSFARNGTTMVGFKKDGTPVWLLCQKVFGATSAEAVKALTNLGCVDILRYDGSWSTQGYLADRAVQPLQRRIVYTLLLAYYRNPYYQRTVTASTLNVRSAPGGAIVDSLKRNTVVTVLEVRGAWVRVGTDRWVNSSYLKA